MFSSDGIAVVDAICANGPAQFYVSRDGGIRWRRLKVPTNGPWSFNQGWEDSNFASAGTSVIYYNAEFMYYCHHGGSHPTWAQSAFWKLNRQGTAMSRGGKFPAC